MRTHAVVWSSDDGRFSGRLEPFPDRFELVGRDHRLVLPFRDLTAVSIARGRTDRLLGMPVLAVECQGGGLVRIAALEGPGLLHDLVDRVEQARAKI